MPLQITHRQPAPRSDNPIVNYLIDLLGKLYDLVRGLVTLDEKVRADRTLSAERAVLFQGSAITTTVLAMEVLIPDVINKDFTTAMIMFDGTSGSGRFRYDGQNPTSAATAVAGLPIPSGGFQLTITGALNIRSFRVVAEPAQALNMSVMLHQ